MSRWPRMFDNPAVEKFIPSNLIEPVAEVLHWVQQLKREQQEQLGYDPPPE